MKKAIFGLLAATALFTGASRAAEPSATSQDHTALYQREVRAALADRGWRITLDDPGKLTAERPRSFHVGENGVVYNNTDKQVRLDIYFRTDRPNHTACSAQTSLVIQNVLSPEGLDLWSHLPYRSQALTKEYFEVLADADSRLATGRPLYTAAGSNRVVKADDSRKVAVK